jgi:tetratricopeptide (TPR) repeat protein
MRPLLASGKAAQVRDDHDEAMNRYRQLVEQNPRNRFGWHRLVVLEAQYGDTENALDCYEKAIQIDPKSADVWSDLANSPYLRERCQDSEHAFQKALELEAKLIIRNNHSMLLARRGQTEDSLLKFQKAGLTEAESRCNLATAQLQTGDLSDAKQQALLAERLDISRRADAKNQQFHDLSQWIETLSGGTAKTGTPVRWGIIDSSNRERCFANPILRHASRHSDIEERGPAAKKARFQTLTKFATLACLHGPEGCEGPATQHQCCGMQMKSNRGFHHSTPWNPLSGELW